MKSKIMLIFAIYLFLFSSFSPSLAVNSYVWTNSSGLLETVSETETDLKLESGSAILIEQSTGNVLYDHNSHEKLRPASVTKVMSILLIMEAIDNRRNCFNR